MKSLVKATAPTTANATTESVIVNQNSQEKCVTSKPVKMTVQATDSASMVSVNARKAGKGRPAAVITSCMEASQVTQQSPAKRDGLELTAMNLSVKTTATIMGYVRMVNACVKPTSGLVPAAKSKCVLIIAVSMASAPTLGNATARSDSHARTALLLSAQTTATIKEIAKKENVTVTRDSLVWTAVRQSALETVLTTASASMESAIVNLDSPDSRVK